MSTRVTSANGGPPVIEGVARDVTGRKRPRKERERLRQEVIEAQRSLLVELSTPLIPLGEGVVVMPLIGAMNAERVEHL